MNSMWHGNKRLGKNKINVVALDNRIIVWSTKLLKYEINTSFYVKMGMKYNFAKYFF